MARCKIWKGAKTPDGYPRRAYKGNANCRWHRVVYANKIGKTLGEIEGVVVMHSCDNRLCIQEDHLIGGTIQLNMLDRAKKERNPIQKITAKQALEIFDLCKNTEQTNSEIGAKYGINFRTVSSIRHKKHFKWLLGG